MRTKIIWVTAAVSVLSGTVRAQDIAAATACSSIESDSERLACYDRALRPTPHIGTQAPSTISTSPRTSTRNAIAPSPQPAQAVAPGAAPPLGVVPIIVLSTRALPGHGVEFTTDRGDVWVQSDTQPLQLPATPFNARIESGTFGSVFLIPENRLGIRVRHRE
jgi:hypothetical protein